MDSTEMPSSAEVTTRPPYIHPFDDRAIIFSGIIIFLFLIIGVTLNSLTITVIKRTVSLNKNVFMMFIVSLCVSDLISALISPLFWYRRTIGFDVWMPPGFMCKLYWATDLLTSYSTSMHILNFAILRYMLIGHRNLFRKVTKRVVTIWITGTWLVSFLFGFIPLWMFTGAKSGIKRDRTKNSPDVIWPACTLLIKTIEQYRAYSKIAYTIFLFVPMVLVMIVTALICGKVLKKSSANPSAESEAISQQRKERNGAIQLGLVVLSFFIGYVPFATYEIWSAATAPKSSPVADYWFGLIQYLFLRFSECLNPIFYHVSSSKMRRHTKNLLGNACKSHGSAPVDTLTTNVHRVTYHSTVEALEVNSVSKNVI